MSRVLENFAIRLKKDVQASLQLEERKKASKYGGSANGNSRLWGTIKITLNPASDPLEISLKMEDYWKYVDKGRRAAGVSELGQAKIVDWVKRKGVNPSNIIDKMRAQAAQKKGLPAPKKKTPFLKAQKQFGFLVSRSMKRKGFVGNEFYSKIINDGRLDKLKVDLMEELKKDVLITVDNGSNNN